MKLHSNIITSEQIQDAALTVPGVGILQLAQSGSRSRARAFLFRLMSDGTPDQHGTPRRNAVALGRSAYTLGQNNPHKAASYADWGHVLAALFVLDPDMVAGPYKGASDFHAQTKGQFVPAAAGSVSA